MNAEIFAEWLRRQKCQVVRTDSSYWYSRAPRIYQAFPYHWLIDPSTAELNEFIREHGVVGLRYSTGLERPEGQVSYHAVYEGGVYNFDVLGKWARKNVRRGLKNCSVEPVSFNRIAEEGWDLQLDTLKRQGRRPTESREQWQRRFIAAKDLPGFEAWGAVVNGKLAASVATFQLEDFCYLLYQQCHGDYLAAHVNNALSFTVSQQALARDGTRGAFYSLESLDAPESMDEFKFRMGYRAKPVRQRVLFNPLVMPLVNAVSHGLLRSLRRVLHSNDSIAKAEGMVRFFLQGKRPAGQQRVSSMLRTNPDTDASTAANTQTQRPSIQDESCDGLFSQSPAPKAALE